MNHCLALQFILDIAMTDLPIRLETNDLLPQLATYQSKFDQSGPLNADVNDKNFLTAMTLRDCTVFLRLPNDLNQAIEARIGDLDLKSPAKKDYWRVTEEKLTSEGWYEGLESRASAQPVECKLDRDGKGRI
jgi:inositol-pentakisphosphate 2-kinase